jgi:hypothetical protein
MVLCGVGLGALNRETWRTRAAGSSTSSSTSPRTLSRRRATACSATLRPPLLLAARGKRVLARCPLIFEAEAPYPLPTSRVGAASHLVFLVALLRAATLRVWQVGCGLMLSGEAGMCTGLNRPANDGGDQLRKAPVGRHRRPRVRRPPHHLGPGPAAPPPRPAPRGRPEPGGLPDLRDGRADRAVGNGIVGGEAARLSYEAGGKEWGAP